MRMGAAVATLLALAGVAIARPWTNYGGDGRHAAQASHVAQSLDAIKWQASVDLAPQYSAGELFIHYGTPLVTSKNTVVFPVKTGTDGAFSIEAHRGRDGTKLWTFDTDYVLASHNWTPPCGACLAKRGVVAPASGGTLLVRPRPDSAKGKTSRIAFFPISSYGTNKQAFDQFVFVASPITAAANGDIYFGFLALPGAPLGLQSGIARISASGRGSWVSAAAASGDSTMTRPALNCAPALSNDGRTLYSAVTDDNGSGYLVALDAKSLARHASVRLTDPMVPGEDSFIDTDSSASPTVGPDGDVYFGVLESDSSFNRFRGWMLHFDAALADSKTPGLFGWDDTVSIVPSSAVSAYTGGSKYLLLSKYNDYVEAGGTGINRMAVLDPTTSETDPDSGVDVMHVVLSVVGPTPDGNNRDVNHPAAVREWCVNTAAVDAKGRCAIVNNEDGVVYRWDFATNSLSQKLVLTAGLGEAYTPTVVGPDGTVFAINDAKLFAVGKGK